MPVQFSSVQSLSRVWLFGTPWTTPPHEPQCMARPPCPSPTPGVHSNSCPSSWWCHPIISSSVVPFSSCPQSFPASGSFQISQFFASGGQIIGTSASVSVPPMGIQDWFPLGWIGLISLQSNGLSRVFSDTTVSKHQSFSSQLFLWSNSHIRWPKHWSFSFSITPFNEYSGLISFRINWFDLLVVQRTLKSLLQHHSSKASAFSLLYGPTLTSIHDHWKNHSLD